MECVSERWGEVGEWDLVEEDEGGFEKPITASAQNEEEGAKLGRRTGQNARTKVLDRSSPSRRGNTAVYC